MHQEKSNIRFFKSKTEIREKQFTAKTDPPSEKTNTAITAIQLFHNIKDTALTMSF